MANPVYGFSGLFSAPLQRGGWYSLQRKESADEDDDRVSHFLCCWGFYRRRYSGSDPTVAVENGETRQGKSQVEENRGEENPHFL